MLGRVIFRHFSSLAEPLSKGSKGRYPVPNTPAYKKLMEKQSIFCREDELMVWQKLPSDMTLFRAASLLVAINGLYAAKCLWQLSLPPNNS